MLYTIKQMTPKIIKEKFYYLEFGKERHGKISFIVYISSLFVQKEEENKNIVKFPLLGKIIKTDKGNLVIKQAQSNDEGYFIFPIETRCGYRGDSDFEIIKPESATAIYYHIFHSPVGSLGISKCGLIITPKFPVIIKVNRTGRTYGEPKSGVFEINENLETIMYPEDFLNIEIE